MLNMTQAAKALGVNRKTLGRWRARGAPFREGERGSVEVDLAELKRWAAKEGLDGSAGRPFGALSEPGGLAAVEVPATLEAMSAEVAAEVEAEFGAGVTPELKEQLARAELRKRLADAGTKEHDLAVRKAETLSAEDVERGQLRAIAIVKEGMLDMGRKLSRKLPGLGAEGVVRVVADEVDALLRQFATEFKPL